MRDQAWPFEDEPNTACITTADVLKKTEWIGFVTHDKDDGYWQFLPSNGAGDSKASVISLQEAFEIDHSIGQLADLPLGWVAFRSNPEDPWMRAPKADANCD